MIEVLLFDGDCAFCTSVADWMRRRLPPDVGVIPWQRAGDLSAYGLTAEEASRAVYWIDARGRAHRGHEAVIEALRGMGGVWERAGKAMAVEPVSAVAEAVYETVARNRHRLPGATPACRR